MILSLVLHLTDETKTKKKHKKINENKNNNETFFSWKHFSNKLFFLFRVQVRKTSVNLKKKQIYRK